MNAADLKAILTGATPAAAAAAESAERKTYRVENFAPPWFRYRRVTAKLDGITVGATRGERPILELHLKDIVEAVESDRFNEERDTAGRYVIEVSAPAAGKRVSRQWEPLVLMQESLAEHGIETLDGAVGRTITLELDVEFITNSDGSPVKDSKGYDRETFFYRVTDVKGGAAKASEPDIENIKKLAEWCNGKTEAEASRAELLKAFAPLGIKDSDLQAIVTRGRFLEVASNAGVLVKGEGDVLEYIG